MPKSHSVKELRDWVALAQGGDKEAFSEVVKRCQDMAYGMRCWAIPVWPRMRPRKRLSLLILTLPRSGNPQRSPAGFGAWSSSIATANDEALNRAIRSTSP